MNNSINYSSNSSKNHLNSPLRASIMSPTKSSAMLVLNSKSVDISPIVKKPSLENLGEKNRPNSSVQNTLVQPKLTIISDQKELPKLACYSNSIPSHYADSSNWLAYKQVKDRNPLTFSEEKYLYNTPTKSYGKAVNSSNESKNVENWRVEKNGSSTVLGGDTHVHFSPQSERKNSNEAPINLVGTSFIYNPSPTHNLPGGGPGPGFGFSSPFSSPHRPLPFSTPHRRGQPIFPTARPENVSMQLQLPGLVREELTPSSESPLVSDKLVKMAQVSGASPLPNPTFRTAGGLLPIPQESRRVINKKNVPIGAPKLLPGESIELLKQREIEKEEKILKKKQEEEEAIARLEGLNTWKSPTKKQQLITESVLPENNLSKSDDTNYPANYPIYSKEEAATVVVNENIPHVFLNEVWSKCWDQEAYCSYYYNIETGEATWVIPDYF